MPRRIEQQEPNSIPVARVEPGTIPQPPGSPEAADRLDAVRIDDPTPDDVANPMEALGRVKDKLSACWAQHTRAVRQTLTTGIEYGGYLAQAQDLARLAGVTWEHWVDSHLPIKANMAGNYMRLYHHRHLLDQMMDGLSPTAKARMTPTAAIKLIAARAKENSPQGQQDAWQGHPQEEPQGQQEARQERQRPKLTKALRKRLTDEIQEHLIEPMQSRIPIRSRKAKNLLNLEDVIDFLVAIGFTTDQFKALSATPTNPRAPTPTPATTHWWAGEFDELFEESMPTHN